MPTFVHDLLLEQNQNEIAKSESLDLKSGILLALVAVLVASNGALLADTHLPKWLEVAQLFSLTVAAVAALFAFIAIIPRRYDWPFGVVSMRAQIEEMEKLMGQAVQLLENLSIKEIVPRLQKNQDINFRRSVWLFCAYSAAALALLLDILTIGASVVDRVWS